MPIQPTSATVQPLNDDDLTPEELAKLKSRMKEIDLILGGKKTARYKLEVMFAKDRSMHRPFGGAVTWWESGTKLHGGGDTKMYLCDNSAAFPKLEGRGCKGLIPEIASGMGHLVCPNCGKLWKSEEVAGEIFYRLNVQDWATILLVWFRRLNLDADIRIKYARDDIRLVARSEQEKQMGGELLGRMREEERRSSSIYPLANIIKDTAAGAELYQRILAFLKS
jgi:hypothetical protein